VVDVAKAQNLTIDYWRIKVDDMIAPQDVDSIYATCLSYITNPTFDAQADSALSAMTLPERRNLFKHAYQTIIDDAPDLIGVTFAGDRLLTESLYETWTWRRAIDGVAVTNLGRLGSSAVSPTGARFVTIGDLRPEMIATVTPAAATALMPWPSRTWNAFSASPLAP